jgi:hypothetical protein
MRNALLALLLIGCGTNDLTLHYKLDGIAPTDVVRVETRVDIDGSDARSFYVDQPFRQVAQGIGYEVRDDDGDGKRTLMITHDATLGYVFAPTFDFRLLPPVGESAPPLSITARAVGVSDMIGETMALGAKFADDAKLAVDLTDARCGGQFCDPNQACCSAACTDVQSDVTNCGGCNVGCAPGGDSCSGSNCRCAGGSACSAGSSCCAGVGCVDLQTDPFHCGDCNHACNTGESCVAGVCKCGTGAACAANTACCGDGTCAGAMGCACGASFCTSTQICCGTTCVDPHTSNSNCGMCGVTCTAPLACANGACACNGAICAPTDSCCASGCANTGNDPNNCGACGHRCRANEVCSGGQCLCGTSQCTAGQLCCGGNCTNQGPMNCGACARSCKMGEACQQGTCTCNGGNNCTGNQVCCPAGTTGGGGGCADLSNDPKHCGDCNTQCNNGDACVLGHCMPSQCNPACTNGNTCFSGECRCNGGPECSDPSTCCGDGCKDLSSDPLNCNACGHKCNPGSYCCKGNCVKPDDNNCSGCNQACGAGSTCCTGCNPPHCAGLGLCVCTG